MKSNKKKNPVTFQPSGWQELLAMAAAIELGIFESLAAEPATAGTLADRLGLDRRGVKTLTLALVHLGRLSLDESSRLNVPTAVADVVVNKKSPSYAPNAILHARNQMERWLTIPEVIRTGRQVERPYTQKRREVFIRSMHDMSRGAAGQIVGLCLKRKPGIGSVLDVGGGPGTYARLFAERGIEVTILDRPEIVEMMSPELKPWPSITMAPGDFNAELTGRLYDLVFMGNILHIYGPDENRLLLARARRALNPGGVIAIVDLVRGRSSRAPLFALTMLVNTDSGGTWTEDEYRGWLQEAGFSGTEVFDIEERDAQLILAGA